MRSQIESLLLSDVALPGQYIGGELGSIVKSKDSVKGRLCFAFPDVYTIGMSNYGLMGFINILLTSIMEFPMLNPFIWHSNEFPGDNP